MTSAQQPEQPEQPEQQEQQEQQETSVTPDYILFGFRNYNEYHDYLNGNPINIELSLTTFTNDNWSGILFDFR
jgi:hypothetical protein